MVIALVLLIFLPAYINCLGDGNIRILEDEIANALQACTDSASSNLRSQRRRRANEDIYRSTSRLNDNFKHITKPYGHEKHKTNDTGHQIYVLNATDYDYEGYGSGDAGEKLFTSVPRTVHDINGSMNLTRTKRNDPLLNKGDSDQCLSQCVFANLQVVDSRGIPREVELWNKVQSSVTSQQSRSALRDQIRACFQELRSEADDSGCSYSNKLERCLMLRFSDRKTNNKDKKS